MTKGEVEFLNNVADALVFLSGVSLMTNMPTQTADEYQSAANKLREIAYKYKEKDNEN